MLRTLISALLIVALAPAAAAAATCAGANPAVTSVVVKSHTSDGRLNHYHLVGTVTNLGGSGQPANVLQSVDIMYDGQKLDSRGVPPLPAGGTHTFTYDWPRSVDSASGSTTLLFRIVLQQGENCNPGNADYNLTF